MAELARRAGISYALARSVVNGHRRYITLHTGLAIARALDCSPWRVQSYIDHLNTLPAQREVRKLAWLSRRRQNARKRDKKRSLLGLPPLLAPSEARMP